MRETSFIITYLQSAKAATQNFSTLKNYSNRPVLGFQSDKISMAYRRGREQWGCAMDKRARGMRIYSSHWGEMVHNREIRDIGARWCSRKKGKGRSFARDARA